MSGNPSNVTPLWGGGSPGPWPPSAVPPGCFSELARLNQCYNEIQMMEMILSKVVCDLAQNNLAFQQCLVEAIAKSGSNVPLIGVTNGSEAQPGQVGEWYLNTTNMTMNLPAATETSIVFANAALLQPGDWDMWYTIQPNFWPEWTEALVAPTPVGVPDWMHSSISSSSPTTGVGVILVSPQGQGNFSVPTLVPVTFNALSPTALSGNVQCIFRARRRR